MKKNCGRITKEDFLLAVKKADRARSLENGSGFKAITKIHPSKKVYNRKEGKKINFEPSFVFSATTITPYTLLFR